MLFQVRISLVDPESLQEWALKAIFESDSAVQAVKDAHAWGEGRKANSGFLGTVLGSVGVCQFLPQRVDETGYIRPSRFFDFYEWKSDRGMCRNNAAMVDEKEQFKRDGAR